MRYKTPLVVLFPSGFDLNAIWDELPTFEGKMGPGRDSVVYSTIDEYRDIDIKLEDMLFVITDHATLLHWRLYRNLDELNASVDTSKPYRVLRAWRIEPEEESELQMEFMSAKLTLKFLLEPQTEQDVILAPPLGKDFRILSYTTPCDVARHIQGYWCRAAELEGVMFS